MSTRDVIFVLGSGRSGTSALTRVLSLCGCDLPRSVLAPGTVDWNPKGFWESTEAMKLNFDFMLQHPDRLTGPGRWFDVAGIDKKEREAFVRRIRSFLTDYPARALLVKAGGLIQLIEFWLEAARREGLGTKVLIPIRHPEEVLNSYTALVGKPISRESFGQSWLELYLQAERHSRDLPRAFIEYSTLLSDWKSEMARVADSLSIELRIEEAKIDNFLSPDLHRQRRSGRAVESLSCPWISRAYGMLSIGARGGTLDIDGFDEIYLAYRENARVLNALIDGYQRARSDLLEFREKLNDWPVWTSDSITHSL